MISKDRPSTKADFAYLYYLPFCMVFTSNDKLHAKAARLFMREDQAFVWGGDLKEEMRRLDAHYSALSAETLQQGIMRFAPEPPDDTTFLTTRLCDRFQPGWRLRKKTTPSPEAVEKLMREICQSADAPTREHVPVDDADFAPIDRRIPVPMGKWRVVPQAPRTTSSPQSSSQPRALSCVVSCGRSSPFNSLNQPTSRFELASARSHHL